ncbi:glycosyltransferase family 32 protein [Calocera cornea HHB12733]|uniref:Glycosyltransferase family 32 protein n=1 Tax=Calocera cornea HHB12733 TaxID=1353952 RepID=A0A165KA99_9BASI|nr:glycosyltransferase family 32 protein [Calocera cornea HHB12733]
MARRTTLILLSILGTILLGTTLLLASISIFLRIDPAAYLSEEDVPWPDPPLSNVSHNPLPAEKIPRILHQTWKDETLPEKWAGVSQGCRDLMPDYEYMLWTDASSRQFIAEHYPWFLDTFDGYPYVIQRADTIRYFVLYHYGGIYLDLDVGCERRLDPLLVHPVILPKTIPVGVSNDLMFTAPQHPFFRRAIHALKGFDHNWIMNYPTVMFSTGPMFVSAVYGLYTAAPGYPRTPEDEVRVLPKSLYGKNAKEGEAPHAFFAHYYGSSWHSDDAGLVLFLGHYGTIIMYIALFILVAGAARLLFLKLRAKHRTRYSALPTAPPSAGLRWRRLGRYDVLLPRIYTDASGRHRLELGGATFSLPSSPRPSGTASTASTSPYGSAAASPLDSPSTSQPILPLSMDSDTPEPLGTGALRWAAGLPARVLSHLSPAPAPHTHTHTHTHAHTSSKAARTRRGSRRSIFFLPAVLQPSRRARSRPSVEGDLEAVQEEAEGYDDVPLTATSDMPLLGPHSPRSGSPPPYDDDDDDDDDDVVPGREHKGH